MAERTYVNPLVAEALPGELKTWSWTTWPEDFLDALDLLLVYFGVNKSLQRAWYKGLMTRKSTEEVPMRRAITTRALRGAKRLISPGVAHNRPKTLWYLPPLNRLKERLAQAGIDIDTVQIIDQRKWGWAFFQLMEYKAPRYSAVRQEQLLKDPKPGPIAEPITYNFTGVTAGMRKRIEEKKKKEAVRAEPKYEVPEVSFGEMLNGRRADY